MRVSYLEVYNEECFDLLSSTGTSGLLPTVQIFENKAGDTILKNLSEIVVSTDSEALDMLFLVCKLAFTETEIILGRRKSSCS